MQTHKLPITLILLALYNVSCGTEPKKYMHHDVYDVAMRKAPPEYINPELQIYVDDFMQICNDNGLQGYGDLSKIRNIDFGPFKGVQVEENTIGLCISAWINIAYVDRVYYSQIIINPTAKNEDPEFLRALMYHELMHCVWGVENHSPLQNQLMSERSADTDYIKEHLDEMLFDAIQNVLNGVD